MAELPALVGHATADGLVLELYSNAVWQTTVAGVPVRVTMETEYPGGETVTLRVEPREAVSFALGLRVPGWCRGAQVAVNGDVTDVAPGRFTVRREWGRRDLVELRLPMPWRLVKGRGVNTGRAAVMRGPQVYCLAAPAPDELVCDAGSLTTATDDPWRTGAVACTLTAGGQELRLREFPDPEGQATFLRFDRLDDAVDDELVQGP